MTEYLHDKLVGALRAHAVNPALSEDEIDRYPYVTFELPVEYRYDKDGAYKIVGSLTIRSVSDDIDEAEAFSASIQAAIAEDFAGAVEGEAYEGVRFTARLLDSREDCMDGVWVIELDYTLNQYK